jgi:hypothetical protein
MDVISEVGVYPYNVYPYGAYSYGAYPYLAEGGGMAWGPVTTAAEGVPGVIVAGILLFSFASTETWAVSPNMASVFAAAFETSIIREFDGLIRLVMATITLAPFSRLVTKTSCPIGRMEWAATRASEFSSWVAVPV